MNSAYEIGRMHLLMGQPTGECVLPISNHFPPAVRDLLVQASHTPIPEWDPLARVKAIDRAVARARIAFPDLFRPQEV